MTTDTANEIESLRAFAVAHNELQFAHLCTAALSGEESEQWAVERVVNALDHINDARDGHAGVCETCERSDLDIIRSTDTTRPDGAIARKMSAPI